MYFDKDQCDTIIRAAKSLHLIAMPAIKSTGNPIIPWNKTFHQDYQLNAFVIKTVLGDWLGVITEVGLSNRTENKDDQAVIVKLGKKLCIRTF